MKVMQIFVLIFSLLVSGLGFANTNTNTAVDYAFIQTANKGSIAPLPHHPGTYILTLKQANPYVTYFSDRPKRIANVISLQQFLNLWNKGVDSFAKDAPNAEASFIQDQHGKMKVTNLTVELVSKHYDEKTNVLTYQLHILGNKAHTVSSMQFEYAVLFIDDDCCCVLNC